LDTPRPSRLHSQILADIGGRELEARDCARAAVQLPLWSIGEPDLAPVANRAESSMEVMRTSYRKWCESGGPEEDFVNSGLGSAQVAQPPPPPSRTKWTRRVPHPVLIGHAASLTPY
jgi:hypothetical protein